MPNEEYTTNEAKSIKVFVRILPLLKRCENCMKISPDKKTIFVRCLKNTKKEQNPLYWSFKTDGIFYDCSQKEIYRDVTSDIIDKVLDGANCAVMSCGQTGTGKSFTIGGLRNNWEHRGLVPRILADLMVARERKKHVNEIHYSLSFVEFRGRNFKDLLKTQLRGLDNIDKRDSLKNITRVSLNSEKDGLRHIFKGEGRRALAEGSTYPSSHLGTGVITFHVRNTSLITSRAVITEAKIHVVEMAGIDSPGKSNCSKKTRDVIAANSMKLEIEHFFTNMDKFGTNGRRIARSSGLMEYLGNCLGRGSIVRFIAHVRVTREDLDVAFSTLRLAAKIGRLQPLKISYKIKPQATMMIEQLFDEIARLRKELRMNEMFLNQEAIANVSKIRAEEIEQDFLRFLNGSISDVKLLSLSQAQILAEMMKNLYAKIIADKLEARKNFEKSESALKTNAVNESKTVVRHSVKDTNEKSSNSKERLSTPSGETVVEIEINKVGALDCSGITLGPGLTQNPANSALRALNASKTSRSRSGARLDERQNEKLEKKESQENLKKAFEIMQKILARSIEATPELRKRWDTSTAISRAT